MNLEEFDSVFCYNGKKICSAINLVSDVIGHDNSLTAIGIAGRAECPFFGLTAIGIAGRAECPFFGLTAIGIAGSAECPFFGLTAIGIVGRAECPFFGHSAKDGLIPKMAESAKEADSALHIVEGFKGEEAIAVVFVLFSAEGDLGGQAALQVLDQRVEAVKNGDDLFLDFK